MFDLVVQKYGGTCMATPERIREVARLIAHRHRGGEKVIAVVSAMGKTTDDLIRLAYSVSASPARRELDMLLSTGERVSMALLSMALHDLGISAISFTGSQAGILTDASHASAKIIDVKPTRVNEALGRGQVVVLAGFQGVNPDTKEITTLGRGGSDTTAVAMAAHYRGARCEIIKEVDGVCSADPKIVSTPKSYRKLTYAALAEMCFWGAKVLHFRSIELAQSHSVPLSIRFLHDHDRGTELHEEVTMFEKEQILAVNSHQEVHHWQIAVADLNTGLTEFQNLLEKNQLGWPVLLASTFDGGHARLMMTSDLEHLEAIARALNGRFQSARAPLSSVTLTCHAGISTSLPARVAAQLEKTGVKVQKTLMSPLSFTVLVEPSRRELAIRSLHEMIKLD